MTIPLIERTFTVSGQMNLGLHILNMLFASI